MQYRCVPYNAEDLLAKAFDFAKQFAPLTSIIGVIIRAFSNWGTGLDEPFAVVRNCKPCILLSSIGLAETGVKEVSLEARRGYAIVADTNFQS